MCASRPVKFERSLLLKSRPHIRALPIGMIIVQQIVRVGNYLGRRFELEDPEDPYPKDSEPKATLALEDPLPLIHHKLSYCSIGTFIMGIGVGGT